MKIQSPEKNLNDIEIENFENLFHIILSENHKKFLLKFNGGYIDDHDNIDTLLSVKYGSSTIEYFMEIHQGIESNLPDNFLPIALDWSDNPITINLIDNSIVIFYFDTDEEPVIIANSLEELLGVDNIDDL
jgi:hypothetical protein